LERCLFGQDYYSTDIIFAVDLSSADGKWFCCDASVGKPGAFTLEDKEKIRKTLLADERFVAIGSVIFQVEKVSVLTPSRICFKKSKYFMDVVTRLFDITPIDNFHEEMNNLLAHLENKKKEKETKKQNLLSYVMSIDKKLEELCFVPGGPIEQEAAKSFSGHMDEQKNEK